MQGKFPFNWMLFTIWSIHSCFVCSFKVQKIRYLDEMVINLWSSWYFACIHDINVLYVYVKDKESSSDFGLCLFSLCLFLYEYPCYIFEKKTRRIGHSLINMNLERKWGWMRKLAILLIIHYMRWTWLLFNKILNPFLNNWIHDHVSILDYDLFIFL